jgi:hypothetical protein
MFGDALSDDFSESLDRLVQDLNDVDGEKDIIGICFSIELLVRLMMQPCAPHDRRRYDQLARKLIKWLLAPAQRNADGLWNPHRFLGHGSIEDSALILFSMRHAVTKYRDKFDLVIDLLRNCRSARGWPDRPASKPDMSASHSDSVSARASIWAFASVARLHQPSQDEWNWYINFLNYYLKLQADTRAPLSVAEMSCVLSTLAFGGYVLTPSVNSLAKLGDRFRSIAEDKRGRVADGAFSRGWRQLRWLTRIPVLTYALLKFDMGLLNSIALEWSPILTLIGFILAVISLAVGVAALR